MVRRKPLRRAMSRRRLFALWASFVFIGLPLGVVLDRHFLGPVRQAVRVAAWASADRKRYHQHAFNVVNIVDGDTLDIEAPDGDSPFTRIRLLGVDTPETQHPTLGKMYFGPEATEYTAHLAQGKVVTVVLDAVSDERDQYGRLLAYLILPKGEMLNENLIRDGFGYADLRFSHSRFEVFVELMEQAIAERRGLWRDVKPEQLPEWLRRRRPDLLR